MNKRGVQKNWSFEKRAPSVYFFNSPPSLKDRILLKQYIIQLLKKEGREVETINIIFCTDNELLDINKRFLNHNYYTDIITFDLSISPLYPLYSELYISIDRIRDNAKSHISSIKTELHRVIFHGLLHLCGYGDKTPKEINIMRLKEEEYLKGYVS